MRYRLRERALAKPLAELAAARATPDEAAFRELHRRVLWNQSPLLAPGAYRRGENRVLDARGNPRLRHAPLRGLRPTGERRRRYYVLGPVLLRTPASGEIPTIAGI